MYDQGVPAEVYYPEAAIAGSSTSTHVKDLCATLVATIWVHDDYDEILLCNSKSEGVM